VPEAVRAGGKHVAGRAPPGLTGVANAVVDGDPARVATVGVDPADVVVSFETREKRARDYPLASLVYADQESITGRRGD
jgi:hypothetical protein